MSIPEDQWPAGMSEMLSAFADAAGEWSVTIDCAGIGFPALSGIGHLQLDVCTTDQFSISTLEGECDGPTAVARCAGSSISLTGWAERAFSGPVGAEVHASADGGGGFALKSSDGAISVTGDLADELRGWVATSIDEADCQLTSFARKK